MIRSWWKFPPRNLVSYLQIRLFPFKKEKIKNRSARNRQITWRIAFDLIPLLNLAVTKKTMRTVAWGLLSAWPCSQAQIASIISAGNRMGSHIITQMTEFRARAWNFLEVDDTLEIEVSLTIDNIIVFYRYIERRNVKEKSEDIMESDFYLFRKKVLSRWLFLLK